MVMDACMTRKPCPEVAVGTGWADGSPIPLPVGAWQTTRGLCNTLRLQTETGGVFMYSAASPPLPLALNLLARL